MTDDPQSETEASDDLRARMRAAVAEVRREGYKAALLYAVVDAALAVVVVTLATALLDLDPLRWSYTLPQPIGGIERIEVDLLVATAVGILVLVGELTLRVRRPLVERFEAVNPAVDEALRTARDALQRDSDSRMARALYADVIERLGETSSVGLVRVPRIAFTLLLVIVVSMVTVQVTIAGVSIAPSDDPPATTPGSPSGSVGGADTPTPSGLVEGDAILGTPEDVTPGSDELPANVSADRGGDGATDDDAYESGGLSGDGSGVDARRAGYAPPEDLENAGLIKEYNLRIREEQDE